MTIGYELSFPEVIWKLPECSENGINLENSDVRCGPRDELAERLNFVLKSARLRAFWQQDELLELMHLGGRGVTV
jgi:hypothetical protein